MRQPPSLCRLGAALLAGVIGIAAAPAHAQTYPSRLIKIAVLPDVPTMSEAGFPELEGGPWFGLLAPAGTPRPIIDWLNSETRKAFSAPDIRELFITQGMALPLGTPEDFAAHIATETKRWGEIIRRSGITVD